jgi:protein involved in polysaccharide export with SLBB domain
MGEVGSPGVFEIGPTGRMSFLEALAHAGGPTTNTSNLGKTLLVRWVHGEQRHHVWKIDARREHWDSEEAVLMAPGDLVFVTNTPIDRAGIWLDMWIRRMIPFPRIFVTGT